MKPFLGPLAIAVVAGCLGSQNVLPGDDMPAPAVGEGRACAIAAGGPGYLAVWEDSRTRLAGGGGQDVRVGNQTDIYAQLLGPDGQALLPAPIVVCNLARNQRTPRVAWNGQAWLVAFVTERPDWYFFDDIVGVRVDASGQVLDATPIAIRPEQPSPANWYGANPSVGSDGVNWTVVWEDWNPANGRPTIAGARVAPSGIVLDPNWPTLYEYAFPSFGPREPQLTFGGGAYLLVWRDLVSSTAMARRFTSGLQPLGPAFSVASYTTNRPPSLATDGAQHYVLVGDRVFRIAASGAVLDVNGIVAAAVPASADQTAHCAWNGSSLSVVQSRGSALANEVYLQRVAANGVVLDATPIQVTNQADFEREAFVAGSVGATEVVFAAWQSNPYRGEDFRCVHVDATGAVSPHVDIDAGVPRQQNVRLVATPSGHVATFVSATSAGTRFLAQRLDVTGAALDATPIEVTTWGPNLSFATASACNGTELLFAWTGGTNCLVRRYDLTLQPLDPQPVLAFAGVTGTPAVAAAGNDFLVAGIVPVTNNTNGVRAVRIQGGTSTVLDPTPLWIGGNYAHEVEVAAFGSGWLVHWTRSASHDNAVTQILANEVTPGGQPGQPFVVSASYYTAASSLAVLGNEALVVYHAGSHGEDGIRAQRLAPGSALVGPEIIVCDTGTGQMFPSVAASGDRWVVAWTDYRNVAAVEAMRGDVYVGRVLANGNVADANGIPLVTGPQPDEDVCVSSNGASLAAYSSLGRGGGPLETLRIVVERIDDAFPSPWHTLGGSVGGALGVPALTGFGPWTSLSQVDLVTTGAAPATFAVLCLGSTPLNTPLFGGVLVPTPEALFLLFTDAAGRAGFAATLGAVPTGAVVLYQTVVLDPTTSVGFTMSNALRSIAP